MMKQIKKLQDLLDEGLQTNILPDKDILKAAINKSCTNLDALLNTPDGAKDVQNLLYAVQNVLLQNKPLFLDLLFQCQIQILLLQIFKTLLSENCKKILNEEDVGGVFEQLLDVVNGIAELSSSAKGSMVTDFLEYSLDLLIRNDVCFRHRMEALKSTNLLLENCPFAVKDRFLKSDLFLNKLNVVINQLPNFGDYEFQVGLIECLFRIIPRKQRESYAVHFFSNAEFSNGLLQIQDNDFETDCRLFLNDFNKSLGVTKRVLSLPCTSAFLGDKELYKPNEPGYDEFWVDFNLTSQRVTIFCEQGSMSSQNSADDLWETVTVWIKDLQNFGITRKKNYVVAHLFLQKSISEIFPSQCDVYGKEVQFHFDPIVDVEDALLKTFGNKYFIKKPEPKVSAVNNPILISSKRNDTKECSSKQQEQQEQQQLHSSDMSSSQFSQGTPSLYRRKVSVPCVPMSTPRSVSSLKSYPNDNVFSKNKTCVNDIRQNKHFSDLDDSSKSACSRNFSAPPSDIPDDCQKPKTKNNCKGMLDKDYMNQKKEFQIPKTPKQTRSKVKVKTPVVMITPRTETGNGKGKGKKNKDDDKRDSAEEMVKNRKKTTQKKKSQCDKLIKEEICLSQQNQENYKDDNSTDESKEDDIENEKEVKKRSSRTSEKKKKLSKSNRKMKNEEVTKQGINGQIHVTEDVEDDVIIPSSMVEERISDSQLSLKSDRIIDSNLLQNLNVNNVQLNHDVNIYVPDSDTLETNKQLSNRKVDSPLSETKDCSQVSNENMQEMKNDLKSVSGSDSSVKDLKELSSNTESSSAFESKAKLKNKNKKSNEVDVISSNLESQKKIITENNITVGNKNKYSGKPKRPLRLNKGKIFKLKNYDMFNTDDVIQSSLDSERTPHILPKSKQVSTQDSQAEPSFCRTSDSPVKKSPARNIHVDHQYDFPDDKDDADISDIKPEMYKRIKSSSDSREERKQTMEKKITKKEQVSKRNNSKLLCDTQKNDSEIISTRDNKSRRKTRKQTFQENLKESSKIHKKSNLLENPSTANSPEDKENDCLYGDDNEAKLESLECKSKVNEINNKHDKNNIIDQHKKKSLQKNIGSVNYKKQIQTKLSDLQLNHSCGITEENQIENNLQDKYDTGFIHKTNSKPSSAREKPTNREKNGIQIMKSKFDHFNTDSPKVVKNRKILRSTGIAYNSNSQKSESTFKRNSVTTVYMTYCATESLKLPSEKGDASKDPYDFDLDCELSQQYDQFDLSNDKNKMSKSKSGLVPDDKPSKNHLNHKGTKSEADSDASEEYDTKTANKYIKKNSVQKNMSYSEIKFSRYEENKRNSKSIKEIKDNQLYSKHENNRGDKSFCSEVQNSSKVNRLDSDASREDLDIKKHSLSDMICNENDNIVASFSRICRGIVSGADIDAEIGSPCNNSNNKSRQSNRRLEKNSDGSILDKHTANKKLQTRQAIGTEPSLLTTDIRKQCNQIDVIADKMPRWKPFYSSSIGESDCEILNENKIEMVTPNLNKAFSDYLSDRSSKTASSEKKVKRKRKQVNYKENSESDSEELDKEEGMIGNCNNTLRTDSDKDVSCLQGSRFLNDSRSEVSWILKRSNKKKPEKVYKREKRLKRLYDNSETEESEIEIRVPVMLEKNCDEVHEQNARKSNIDRLKREKSILRTPMTPAGDHIAYIDEEYSFMPVLSLEALANHYRTEKTNSTIDDIASISCMSSLRTPKTPVSMCNYFEIENGDEDQEHVESGKILAFQNGFVSGPSTEMRPTKSSLKRKFKDVAFGSEESQKSSGSVEDFVEDGELESSKLIPRKLFKEEIKVLKRSCDDENSSSRSINTNDNQTEINLDLPEEEHNATYSGVSTLLNAFSGDIQRQMQDKKHHLETLTKAAVKSTQRAISKSWWDQHDSRQKVLHDFKNKLMLEVLALEADISKVKDAEDETMIFFRKQLQVLQNHRLSQEKRIRNLNELQNCFHENIIGVENATEKQKSLKDVIRKDLITLQKKLLQKFQQQELMNVKKSLQSMLQYS